MPGGASYATDIDGTLQLMCCPGCQAVAQAIVDHGLVDFYRHRTGPAASAQEFVPPELAEFELFDEPDLQRDFVRGVEDGLQEASLSVEGITCPACAWLIERHLARVPGVAEVAVNLSGHRARLVFDPKSTALSPILRAFTEIGFRAQPHRPDRQEAILREEERLALRRLGVAGLGAMQVMTFAVALYAGALQGMEDRYRDFLRYVSLLVAIPVVFYAARPFFNGALRDLRARQLGMDVPVALAIGAAFLASGWATLSRDGEVYFDSVCTFTFFLGLGRYLEMRVRHRADAKARRLVSGVPEVARRLTEEGEEVVAARALVPGDRVLVRAGDTVPADGVVREGESSVSEALLTGEERPRSRCPGERVVGGSQNLESSLVVEVTHIGAESTLAAIQALLDRAQSEKPPVALLADRVARVFVACLLAVAIVVAFSWWWIAPREAFWITLSVLVATCPCALSLATPAALAAATSGLAAAGFLVTRGHVLGGLGRLSHVIFDKTGTLTLGRMRVAAILPAGRWTSDEALSLARALERHSEHPVARAILSGNAGRDRENESREDAQPVVALEMPRSLPGLGVEGRLPGRLVRIGRPDWAWELASQQSKPPTPPGDGHFILLADEAGPVAWFELEDEVRPDAAKTVAALRRLNVEVELLSGDPSPAVARLAAEVGISKVRSGASPDEKVRHVRALQQAGAMVAMVGDGINDAPVLGQAQVSVAMGSGSDLARISADVVLLGDQLHLLTPAIRLARKTWVVIRQNLAWALAYNLTVLPLAVTGHLAPWVAAIGMSASSLLVVTNALRLTRGPERE